MSRPLATLALDTDETPEVKFLLLAAINLENDDGSIPAHAWNPLQQAIAGVLGLGATGKEISK